jgi:hypothetical protein
MTTAKEFLNRFRSREIDNRKKLYLENTKVRDKDDRSLIIYNVKDINQKVYYRFSARGFYWAIQYANEWAKNNNAVITGTTLTDCKDYINTTIKPNCNNCK